MMFYSGPVKKEKSLIGRFEFLDPNQKWWVIPQNHGWSKTVSSAKMGFINGWSFPKIEKWVMTNHFFRVETPG